MDSVNNIENQRNSVRMPIMSPAIAYIFPSSFSNLIFVNANFDNKIAEAPRKGDAINNVNNILSAPLKRKEDRNIAGATNDRMKLAMASLLFIIF